MQSFGALLILKIKAYVEDRRERQLPNPIAASMDAAWLTRGNGKFTNSKTGHAELIGIYGGEVIASGRRHRHCSLCRTKSPEDHDCHANWTGSSKAMEADIIANLVLDLKGARVTVLVGDEDSSTMAKVRELVPWQVLKVIDVVHAKKNFGGALFAVRLKLLTPKVIEYLKDCFSYALHQNRDRPLQVKAAILNIPNHVFNEHENCGSWCRFQREPETYQHRRLPEIWAGSADMKLALRNAITTVCEKFASKAQSLAPCLSSNTNESFNFVVTTFSPKSRHYAGTLSVDRRIDGAVLQKNQGVQYILGVNKELNLSPGEHTIKNRMAVAAAKKRKSEKSKLPEEKIKRRKNLIAAINDQLRKESTEGVSYESAMGFSTTTPDVPSVTEQTEINQDSSVTKEKAKPKRHAPAGTPLATRIAADQDFEVVVLDTETTGFTYKDEIVQLAAKSSSSTFNSYCYPNVKITADAAETNKLSCRTGKLYQDGKLVVTVDRKTMLEQFLEFLDKQNLPILVVAHNAHFDLRLLWQEIEANNLSEHFLKYFIGYVDSVKFFKHKVPQLEKHKLKLVCTEILGKSFSFDEHNAVGDVEALSKCLEMTGFGKEEAIKFSVNCEAFLKNLNRLENSKELIKSLADISSKTLTEATVKSLVANNLNFATLQTLSTNKDDFMNAVMKCFKQRASARSEDILEMFTLHAAKLNQ